MRDIAVTALVTRATLVRGVERVHFLYHLAPLEGLRAFGKSNASALERDSLIPLSGIVFHGNPLQTAHEGKARFVFHVVGH